MVNDYNSLSGLQKVAVLFSVVGEGLALSLVKGLSKTEIRKIRSTLQTMGTISFNVKKRVMEEFYFGFLSEDVGQNGTDGNAIHPFDFLKDFWYASPFMYVVFPRFLIFMPNIRNIRPIIRENASTNGTVIVRYFK